MPAHILNQMARPAVASTRKGAFFNARLTRACSFTINSEFTNFAWRFNHTGSYFTTNQCMCTGSKRSRPKFRRVHFEQWADGDILSQAVIIGKLSSSISCESSRKCHAIDYLDFRQPYLLGLVCRFSAAVEFSFASIYIIAIYALLISWSTQKMTSLMITCNWIAFACCMQ